MNIERVGPYPLAHSPRRPARDARSWRSSSPTSALIDGDPQRRLAGADRQRRHAARHRQGRARDARHPPGLRPAGRRRGGDRRRGRRREPGRDRLRHQLRRAAAAHRRWQRRRDRRGCPRWWTRSTRRSRPASALERACSLLDRRELDGVLERGRGVGGESAATAMPSDLERIESGGRLPGAGARRASRRARASAGAPARLARLGQPLPRGADRRRGLRRGRGDALGVRRRRSSRS